MITNLNTNSTSLTGPAPEAIRETTIVLSHESFVQMEQQIAKKDAALRVAMQSIGELVSDAHTHEAIERAGAAVAKIKEAL